MRAEHEGGKIDASPGVFALDLGLFFAFRGNLSPLRVPWL